eukprot:TRINITY_DN10488_c0_g1_i1.p1 TRINITY_DN10488_c0_g1~~TRINITY_DN10488_c0_g1_i1.p1  ORF type:complete len:314 (+),score=44.91 TRINITY_DN10488_c0_g1_i1:47-988(+)
MVINRFRGYAWVKNRPVYSCRYIRCVPNKLGRRILDAAKGKIDATHVYRYFFETHLGQHPDFPYSEPIRVEYNSRSAVFFNAQDAYTNRLDHPLRPDSSSGGGIAAASAPQAAPGDDKNRKFKIFTLDKPLVNQPPLCDLYAMFWAGPEPEILNAAFSQPMPSCSIVIELKNDAAHVDPQALQDAAAELSGYPVVACKVERGVARLLFASVQGAYSFVLNCYVKEIFDVYLSKYCLPKHIRYGDSDNMYFHHAPVAAAVDKYVDEISARAAQLQPPQQRPDVNEHMESDLAAWGPSEAGSPASKRRKSEEQPP